jgi:hypothetical protein
MFIRVFVSISLAVILFSTCQHSSDSEKRDFEYYYDMDKIKLKMKGSYVSGRESGEWTYYNYDGSIEQQGTFDKGVRIGNWNYNYKGALDTVIIWNRWQDSMPNFTFSLPSSFIKSIDSSQDVLIAIDTLEKTIFSIKKVKNINMLTYYREVVNKLVKDYEVRGDSPIELANPDGKGYYVCFFQIKEQDIQCLMSSAYFFLDNMLIDFSYSCAIEDSSIGKKVFGDIIQAAYYNGIRIASPLDKVNKSS